MTHWWVLLASLPLHTCCRLPTSHCDSLVVFRRVCTLLQPPTSCNSLLAGYPRQSPIFTPAANHQRVIVTRWWLFIASAPSFNHQRVIATRRWLFIISAPYYLQLQPPTTLYDLLVGFYYYYYYYFIFIILLLL